MVTGGVDEEGLVSDGVDEEGLVSAAAAAVKLFYNLLLLSILIKDNSTVHSVQISFEESFYLLYS